MFRVGDIVRLTEDAMRRFPDRIRGDYVITKIYNHSIGNEVMIRAKGINHNSVINGMYIYRFELADKRNTNKSKYTT